VFAKDLPAVWVFKSVDEVPRRPTGEETLRERLASLELEKQVVMPA
jgi:hypothetical protein